MTAYALAHQTRPSGVERASENLRLRTLTPADPCDSHEGLRVSAAITREPSRRSGRQSCPTVWARRVCGDPGFSAASRPGPSPHLLQPLMLRARRTAPRLPSTCTY